MVILTFSAFYLPGFKGGGPIKTLKNLFDQTENDLFYRLITNDRDLGDWLPYESVECGAWNKVGNTEVFYAEPGVRGYWKIAKILLDRQYDIVYLNSFFSPRFSFFPLLIAKLLRQKVVLGPRGEFSEGALSLKSGKKQFFIKLYKFLRLHKGVVFQASSEYEAEDIRRTLGSKVDIQIAEDIGAQEFAEVLPTRASESLKIVFISRISPKKNLLAALEMLRSIQQPVLYHIYGPIEDLEYWAKCEAVISVLPSHVQVEHKGELTPDQVVPTLSAYDMFFMPTKGENYGHVIAEALCAGLPILIADTTPWRNLQEQGIGWDLPLNDPNAFSTAIDQLALMPAKQHLQMRETVLVWAKEKFTQRDAIQANINMFRYAYEKK
ncbi:glycosyltransferase [Oceanospirillaceae bacterium ASx5O]|nr:glycosyltransferase [Oceanospirillaceae bacterium ASx5O]